MSEKTQLATTTESAPAPMDLGQMFQSMIELAKDPSVDPAKMEAMLGMQERMLDRAALQQYRAAMHAARAEMPTITKDGRIKNHKTGELQSRYAHYEAIDKIVRPLVERHGLTYGFDYKEGESGRVLVTCIVSHVGGHEERFGPMPLAVDTTGAKNATQGAGSAGSYGKRYTLCAAFNIVTEGQDDDGNNGRVLEAPSLDAQFADMLVEARDAARQGSAAYEKWFKSRTGMERGWLMDKRHHQKLKADAEGVDNA